jgi:hypothetical protein
MTADTRRPSPPRAGRWRRPCAALLGLAWAASAQCALARTAADETPQQYAIVVNGDDSFTHNRNVEIAAGALAKLGYPPANTFLLVASRKAPEGSAAVVRAASRRGLSGTLATLKARMHPNDLLLVYLTGHGIRFFGHAVLEIENGSIGAAALAREVSALPFDRLILVADQCYSGAFVKAFSELGRNVVAVSSTDERHEVRCEPFVRPFWAAAVDAAASRRAGGQVAVEEAFQVGLDSLAAGGSGGSGARLVASGACHGHANLFSLAPGH